MSITLTRSDIIRLLKGLECSVLTSSANKYSDFSYFRQELLTEPVRNETDAQRDANMRKAMRREACKAQKTVRTCVRTANCRTRSSSGGVFSCELGEDIAEIIPGERYWTRYGIMEILALIKSTGAPTILAIQCKETQAIYITFPCYSLDLLPTSDDMFNIKANLQPVDVHGVTLVAGLYSISLRFDKVLDWIYDRGTKNPGEPIYLCGFSLGGSLARIMAFRIHHRVRQAQRMKFAAVQLYVSGENRSGGDSWLEFWRTTTETDDSVIRKVVSVGLGVVREGVFFTDPAMNYKDMFNGNLLSGRSGSLPLRSIPQKLILDMETQRPPIRTLEIKMDYSTAIPRIETEIYMAIDDRPDDRFMLHVEPYKSVLFPEKKAHIDLIDTRLNSLVMPLRAEVHVLRRYRETVHAYMKQLPDPNQGDGKRQRQ